MRSKRDCGRTAGQVRVVQGVNCHYMEEKLAGEGYIAGEEDIGKVNRVLWPRSSILTKASLVASFC